MTIKINKILFVTTTIVLLSGCATNRYVTDRNDPLEPLNRGFYKFNKTVDQLYLKPVSRTYELIVPEALRNLIHNFFSNINEIPTIANSLLQAKMQQACTSTARFTINSTLGVGGLFDVATKGNLLRAREDFGTTLAAWGYKDSYYLVLPLLGPSTIRDGIGALGNIFVHPAYYLKPKWRNRYEVGYAIDKRTELKEAESFIDTLGIDGYKSQRDSYLQNRNYKINHKQISNNNALLQEPPE